MTSFPNAPQSRSSATYTLLRIRMSNEQKAFESHAARRGTRLTAITVDAYGPAGRQYMLNSRAYLRAIGLEWDNGFQCSYGDMRPSATRWRVPAGESVSQVAIHRQDMSGFDALTGLEFITDKGTQSPFFGGRDVARDGRPLNRELIGFEGLRLIGLGGTTVPWDSAYDRDPHAAIRQLSFEFAAGAKVGYAPGDAVEVFVSGGWVPGVYKHDAGAFPGKAARPHAVEYWIGDQGFDDYFAPDGIRAVR